MAGNIQSNWTGAPQGPMYSDPHGAVRVKITDINMPFGSMVVFMIKWAIASIPAVIIMWIFMFVVMMMFGLVFGTLGAIGNSYRMNM